MQENPTTQSGEDDSLLRVVFAPDFRTLGPYQELLSDALAARRTEVGYLEGYRRGLPLYRGLKGMPMDILHMHYPVYYFPQYNPWSGWRKLRFPLDLRLATMRVPLVYTVHDLYPLDDRENLVNRFANEAVLKQAAALIIHSEALRGVIESTFGKYGEKCVVIPHGDLSPSYGALPDGKAARKELGLGGGKVCLVFGILTRNKGAKEILEFWKRESPDATLAIVGCLKDSEYGRELTELAAGARDIVLNFDFQTNEQLKLWFSAADCVAINYEQIYTSGVASLARSYGIPVLLPRRHTTLDLQEPHASVFRFDSTETDFGGQLKAALEYERSYAAAEAWRKAISWDRIAEQTREVYERVLGK